MRFKFKKGNQYWRLRDQEKCAELVKKNNKKPAFRKKVSITMKEKWKDEKYRESQTKSFQNRKTSKHKCGSHRKNLTLIQEYGKEKAEKIRKKIKKTNTGRKFSDEINKKKGRFGKENAMSRPEIKEKQLNACRTYGAQWKGGISFEPYNKEFNIRFKRLIRKRDNYICLKCGKHQEKEGKSLCVHHINYNKKLSIPENCCSLCFKCHSEVNWNRKHYSIFFQSILSEKYNYEYSKKQEIIYEVNNG